MSDHYSMDLVPDDDGWFMAECSCGWKAGMTGGKYPTAEDACDALMDHAYDAGVKDAQAAVSSPEEPA